MHLQQNQKMTDRAASESIGAVMLISVVVLAVAIIGVVLTSQGTPQQIPALDAVISNYGNQIQIYHNGGDTLQSNEIDILVDGNLQTFKKGGAAWTSWSPGESLVADVSSVPDIVRIVYKGPSGSKTTLATADFSPSGMSNYGPISTSTLHAAFSSSPSSGTPPLVVQFTDQSTGSPVGYNWAFGDGGTSTGQNPTHVFGTAGTYTVSLTVTNSTGATSSATHPVTVSTSAPTVISTSPASGTRGTSFPVSVYGTGFINGASFRLRSGTTDIPATSVVFGSGTTLSGTISIPSGSATGPWNVVVTNPDSQTGTLTNGFTVTAPSGPPTVSAPTPASGATGSTIFITSLPGTNFQTGAQVKLNSSAAPDISAANITVLSSTQISCTFYLSGAATGPRNIVVTNPDGQAGMQPNGFTITSTSAPTVSAPTPASGATGSTIFITNLPGSNFQTGAQVKLNSSAAPDISAANITVVSPTQITCTFYLSGTSTGPRNVVVTNPDGQAGMLANGFTITSTSAPTVSAITPSSGTSGSMATISNLAGSGFQNGATVKLNSSTLGSDIPAAGVTVVSPTQITCTFYLTGAAAGNWNVVVTNPDGQNGMKSVAFTVNATPPSPVTADFTGSPTTGTAPLTVQFADASTGSPSTYSWNFGDSGTSTVRNPSHSYASAGTYTVSLTVGNGTAYTSTRSQTGFVIVSAAPTPPPVIQTVVPVTVKKNTNTKITITGTGFQSPISTTEVIFMQHGGTPVIAGTSVTYVSSTQITCQFTSANTANLVYDVEVINPDYQTAIKSSVITTTN